MNPVEAEAIVAEIESVVKDPVYAGRTMGVISLIGAQQAHFIQQLLLERIGEEAFLRHKIACGDSATFQGKERDIMFISMVDGPGDSARTSQVYQQRFNVALSRARDRMYIFRSVAEEKLKNAEDLRLKVIRHFKSPMPPAQQPIDDLIELCESDFERDVFTRLASLGYCITPQVGAGNWRIDLVIEGNNNRRLAIELDGDKWHPPEKWLEDMGRQRTMERMGWHFWRCWASSFWRDPEGCMADLITTLTVADIEPISRGTSTNIYTEHRVVQTDESGKLERESGPTEGELIVEVDDRVLVSYNDDPRRRLTIRVSGDQHDPDLGIFKASSLAGVELLGAAADDEINLPLETGDRIITIIAIEKFVIEKAANEKPVIKNFAPIETTRATQQKTETASTDPKQTELPVKAEERPPAQALVTPKPMQSSLLMTLPTSNEGPPAAGLVGDNRVLGELRIMDERFQNPRCPGCGRAAHPAVTNEGVVVTCKGCKKVERVGTEVLQRLAERLSVACFSCRSGTLKSSVGK